MEKIKTETKGQHTPRGYQGLNDIHIQGVEEALQKFGFHERAVVDVVRAVNEYDRLKRIEEKAKLAADALETIQHRNEELLQTLKDVRSSLEFVVSGVGQVDNSAMLKGVNEAIAKAEGGK